MSTSPPPLHLAGLSALPAPQAAPGERVGVSSSTSVSLEPALVSVFVARTSTTWPVPRPAPQVGVSVSAADQVAAGAQLVARPGDRFTGLGRRTTTDDAVLLDGACARLDCSVEAEHRSGEHTVVLRVHDLDGDRTTSPLVFHGSRFRRLLP